MTVSVQIAADGTPAVATPLPALSELCARFLADPASGGWSVVLLDADGAFATRTPAEAAAVAEGLELRFKAPDGERWALVLTVADGTVTSAVIEYRGEAGGQIVERIEQPVATLDIVGGHVYRCGQMQSLTLRSVEDSPHEAVVAFRSGTLPTELVLPQSLGVVGYAVPQPECDYEISIRNRIAVIVHTSQP